VAFFGSAKFVALFSKKKKCHKSVTKKISKKKLSQICDKMKNENEIVTDL